MAVTLNLRRLGLRRSQLRCDDIKLAGLLGDRSDRELFRLRRVAMPDAKANEPDVAENFFYGSFEDLKAPPRQGRWRLVYSLPDAFLEYSSVSLLTLCRSWTRRPLILEP